MCCLFGLIDPQHRFTGKQKGKMLHALATASEVRGTDATGVAYNTQNGLCISKYPIPGRRFRFRVQDDTTVAMGHTRMATQGNARYRFNAHPFYGTVGNTPFALAHNGMIHNDWELQRTYHLPKSRIATDSYVAVQLLEQRNDLSFESLAYAAEQLEGSFTLTLLDRADNLYFIKGNNPMTIYHFKDSGLYLYASTEDILKTAILCIPYRLGTPVPINITTGEILQISSTGKQRRGQFDDSKLYRHQRMPYSGWSGFSLSGTKTGKQSHTQYLDDLKSIASFFGFAPAYVDYLLGEGVDPMEIEEMLYNGELEGSTYESVGSRAW